MFDHFISDTGCHGRDLGIDTSIGSLYRKYTLNLPIKRVIDAYTILFSMTPLLIVELIPIYQNDMEESLTSILNRTFRLILQYWLYRHSVWSWRSKRVCRLLFMPPGLTRKKIHKRGIRRELLIAKKWSGAMDNIWVNMGIDGAYKSRQPQKTSHNRTSAWVVALMIIMNWNILLGKIGVPGSFRWPRKSVQSFTTYSLLESTEFVYNHSIQLFMQHDSCCVWLR